MLKQIIILFFCSLCVFTTYGQRKKLELLGADELEGVMYKDQKANRLKGHVKIKHDGSLMACDVGYMFSGSNDFDAFGKVSIKKPGGVTIYGDSLFYSGDTKIAKLRGNVRVIDDKMTLKTNHLDYNMEDETAWYYGGGTIVDDGTKLSSQTGFFDSNQDFYSFKGDVKVNKNGTRIEADTLKYASGPQKAYFFGPTNIYTEDKTLYAESGIYNAAEDKSWFSDNAWVETPTYKLYGDSLYFDNVTEYGYAINNVKIESFKDSATIYGNIAINNGAENKSTVIGNALMIDRSGNDTTYINADTLISITDTVSGGSQVFAYRNVRIIKGELRGICDSMVYDGLDSTIAFYYDPILWNGKSQIIGDSIRIIMKNDQVDKMNVYQNSFIISQNEKDSIKFDQVEGDIMLAYFNNSQLYQLDVDGNGHSIYYAFNEEKEFIGLNNVVCANMKMFVVDGNMNNIRFYDRPIASFIPPQMITEQKRKLPKFVWYIDKKPTIEQLISEIDNRTFVESLDAPLIVKEEVLVIEEKDTKQEKKIKKAKRKEAEALEKKENKKKLKDR